MRKLSLLAVAAALVGLGLIEIQESARAQTPSSSQGQTSAAKTVISGGDNMGTYIDAVQANFGNPNVTVTLPTLSNQKNK